MDFFKICYLNEGAKVINFSFFSDEYAEKIA